MSFSTLPPADDARSQRGRFLALYLPLIAFNVAAWAWAFIAFSGQTLLMGTCLVAYSLGLRHAVDADHIAAIDNATRKMMQAGQRPIAAGLMFSLGHSTVVVAACIGVALAAGTVQARVAEWREIGSTIGTLVSTGFLFAVALVNVAILSSAVRAWRRVRAGSPIVSIPTGAPFAGGGLLARVVQPLMRLVTRSHHMYWLGLLFGVGFDTATEIALLGISATNAAQGTPIASILVMPALFTAGMTLVDTTDSLLMVRAYGWALVDPMRKLRYNIAITTCSIVVAFGVGTVEALGLVGDAWHRDGPIWQAVRALNEHFSTIGYLIAGLFLLCWMASVGAHERRRLRQAD
ncbi:HoxN/HupN/NixA family nickel/cobalt transporter [Trinickia caryophylli]|nr:HoxN/HupN/NixA family nickel/cobalt transporter [Trinickia caryophylli]PMS14317.1 HoxN/HupN/NixA family nickel/cobalt transporter [Trinickia caryophylli]TRX17905.1 HoxN/HupN/NixA family nickel/cobalt transporter [Trinickia caryophylli]WQE11323.1 HoxN/HupN/NixA family nickel/cobalt transporter [Trinickia caryophylli]